jgi:hypothetical protein
MILGEQCYFYAGLVYSAVKLHFGEHANENADFDYFNNSSQLRKYDHNYNFQQIIGYV